MTVTVFRISLLASLLSIAAALAAQYGFDLKPCHLCLIERIPYVAVIVLSLAGLALPVARKPVLAYVIALMFLSGCAVGAYHVAVEKHWVAGPASCTSSESMVGQSVEDLLKKIQSAPIVACDQPQWDFYGITLAQMNALWSLALALAVVLMGHRGEHA